jgi:hypothetical protein
MFILWKKSNPTFFLILHLFFLLYIPINISTISYIHVNIQNMKKWGIFLIEKKLLGILLCFFFIKNTLKCCNNNTFIFTVFNIFFLSLKYKYTIMCNYFNNYDNLNGCMLITFGVHLYEQCITYLYLVNFQNCAAIKKKSLWFQSILLFKYHDILGWLDKLCFHTKVKKLFS